jgi:hypothetical protein
VTTPFDHDAMFRFAASSAFEEEERITATMIIKNPDDRMSFSGWAFCFVKHRGGARDFIARREGEGGRGE